MLTKEDKESILKAFKLVDLKTMSIEHEDENIVKWFRFGNYNAMQIASEIIKKMPEKAGKK